MNPDGLEKALKRSSLEIVTFSEVCMFADKEAGAELPLQFPTFRTFEVTFILFYFIFFKKSPNKKNR